MLICCEDERLGCQCEILENTCDDCLRCDFDVIFRRIKGGRLLYCRPNLGRLTGTVAVRSTKVLIG